MRAWGIVVCGALACACGSEAEAPSETSDHLIKSYLQDKWGFDREQIVVRGDRVFVDDAFFERENLLMEIADSGFSAAPGLHEEGYYRTIGPGKVPGVPVGPGLASNGYFKFSAAVPEAWRNSFRTAFSLWSTASSSDCVSFQEGTAPSASASQITIGVGEAGTAADGGPAGAIGSWPFFDAVKLHRPGATITIDTDSAGSQDASWRLHTALHEIGHNLGFTHPWDGFRIPGTTENGNSGCCSASYFTVMDYFGDTALSLDDKTALSKVFVKRVPISKNPQPANCRY